MSRLTVRVLLAAAFASSCFAVSAADLFQTIRDNQLGALQQVCSDKSAINQPDTKLTTPLHFAAAYGSVESVRLLLRCGADVKALNAMGATALILAASNTAKVRLLLEAGADPNAATKSGRTALIIASGVPGGTEAVRQLLDKGAHIDSADERGINAILNATQSGDIDAIRLLLKRGANGKLPDKSGFTIHHNSTNSVDLARLKLVIGSGGPDVNSINAFGGQVRKGPIALTKMTPLILAAAQGTEIQVRTLLAAGAKVNVTDGRGLTPLMAAVSSENQDIQVIRALVEAGADVNAADTNGETVLDWARKFRYPATISLLEKAGARSRAIPSPVPVRSAPPLSAGRAAEQALALLHKSSTEFFRESGCVACHHQPMMFRAMAAAASAGIAIPPSAREVQTTAVSTARAVEPLLLQFMDIGGAADAVAAVLVGFASVEVPPNAMTDAAVNYLAGTQNLDGSWTSFGVSRAPSEDSSITRTALSVRAIRAYGWPARKSEWDERVSRARKWLTKAEPKTTYERSDLLLGLHWAGASAADVARVGKPLMVEQHPDGGWSQNRYLATDAYATGLALYALRESDALPVTDPAYRRGVGFLLRTQLEDGSWYVRSRSPKFQPYFQSGFPHDHDQWISATATAYAVMAIAPAARETQTASGK